MRKLLGVLCTLMVCACCASAPKQHVYGALPLQPEAWFERLYNQAIKCIVSQGDSIHNSSTYAGIHWYVTPHGAMGDAIGLWSWPHNIFLDADYTTSMYVIRHEELHDLLGAGFVGDPHVAPTFAHCVDAPFEDGASN